LVKGIGCKSQQIGKGRELGQDLNKRDILEKKKGVLKESQSPFRAARCGGKQKRRRHGFVAVNVKRGSRLGGARERRKEIFGGGRVYVEGG